MSGTTQTYFWRKSLGFCLKKDGQVCHVVAKGNRCVAAASNDAGTMLVALDATLEIATAGSTRRVPIREFYKPDGAANKKLDPGELLVGIEVPPLPDSHHSGYRKLRTRRSVDFPKLSVAATYTLGKGGAGGGGTDGAIADATLVVSAIAAVPRLVRGIEEAARGSAPSSELFQTLGERARKVVHPLTNLDGDTEYRKSMVAVFVRRAFEGAVRRRV